MVKVSYDKELRSEDDTNKKLTLKFSGERTEGGRTLEFKVSVKGSADAMEEYKKSLKLQNFNQLIELDLKGC